MMRTAVETMDARRILMVRPDHLGDVLLFSGALRHIRRRFPDAYIELCVQEYARPLVELCPHIDRIVSWESLRHDYGGAAPPGFHPRRILRRLTRAARPWDLVMLPVRSPSAPMQDVVAAMPAKARVAIVGDRSNLESAEVSHAYTSSVDVSGRGTDHEFDVLRDFLGLIGIQSSEMQPEVWTCADDAVLAEVEFRHLAGRRVLGLAPGSSFSEMRQYSATDLARAVADQDSADAIVLLGAASERAVCARVAARLAALRPDLQIVDLSGRTGIRELIEVLRRCDVVLSMETGTLHLAIALDRPTVGIVGGGHFGRFAPWGDASRHRIAHAPMPCYGCNWKCRYDSVRCIEGIRPADITRLLATAAEQQVPA